MAAPLKTSMPPDVIIDSGYMLRIAALDSTTGNAVANVNISNMVIEVETIAGELPGETFVLGPFMFVPGPGA